MGRVSHTPNDEYILILNADAEENDIGIWNTTLNTHTQPEFDAEVTIGGGVSVNGTEFYQDGNDWEAWIPQTSGDNVAVLNLTTNEVDYINIGNLTIPEEARHFSRIGEIDNNYFFTYSDEGGTRIDLHTYEVSKSIPLGGQVSRIAVVKTEPVIPISFSAFLDSTQVVTDSTFESTASGIAGSEDDTVILGTGERIVGAAGSDRFFATAGGDNIITGGTDKDEFWLANAEIPDTANIITDFTIGEDVIGIAGLGINFEAINITQQGDNALITINSIDLAILQDINIATLISDDFVFI